MAKDAPKIMVYPPFAFLEILGVAIALEVFIPLPLLPERGFGWAMFAGIGLLQAAATIGLWALVAFKSADTPVSPHATPRNFTRKGPYRFTRNPMYISLLLVLEACAFGLSLDWALFLGPVLWAMLHYGVVLREEAYLKAKFGAEYEAYLSQTKRWI